MQSWSRTNGRWTSYT